MSLRVLPLMLVVALGLGACSAHNPTSPEITSAQASTESSAPPASPAFPASVLPAEPTDGLLIDALPAPPAGRNSQDTCPYLDTEWVAQTNGQRVTGVGVDENYLTPACVFWSFPPEPQLTVIVRAMASPEEATAVVDWAAPIDSTDPVEEGGFSGGRSGLGTQGYVLPTGHTGSLYAVAKDNTAIVVFSNQEQSLKAELVAKEVIGNLGL